MKMRIADCGLRSIAVVAFVIAATVSSFADEVYSRNKKGNELYKDKKYDEALKQYDDALLLAPNDSLLKMNRGSTLYRLGKYAEAESSYTAALSLKDKKKLADAHYNMGNILFKEGDQLMQTGNQEAGEKYKAALQNYIAAHDLRPDKDAKWNIELTQRRIKQQEQQQKNQQNQDKNKDQNKQDKNQDQNNKNQKNDQNKQDQNKDQKQNDQNKQNQDKNKKDQDKNKQDQDKKQDQKKDQQDQNKDQNKDQQNDKDQKKQPQPQPRNAKDEVKKADAKRLIEQFADDADTLNKPPKKQGLLMRQRKPEKDW
jgi:Ca-activated chloride channel homolog